MTKYDSRDEVLWSEYDGCVVKDDVPRLIGLLKTQEDTMACKQLQTPKIFYYQNVHRSTEQMLLIK